MIAVDTNVIVRLVTNDDPAQARRAATLLDTNEVFVSKTVALETEWVLRSAYRLSAKKIHAAFEGLLALPSLRVEDPEAIARALGWYRGKMDFADALHLASSTRASAFATFDRTVIQKMRRLAPERPARAV